MKRAILVLLSALLLPMVAGCEDGPAERAGEKIDNAADKIEDAAN